MDSEREVMVTLAGASEPDLVIALDLRGDRATHFEYTGSSP